MIILVDSNEAATAPGIVDAMQRHFSAMHISQLQAGDVNVMTPQGILAVERKTPGDLLSSIGDGRLFEQCRAMVAFARFSLLVVHGSLLYDHRDKVIADGRDTTNDGKSKGWDGVAVRAALRVAQWSGVNVEFCRGGEYIATLDEAIHTASKERFPAVPRPAITLETLDPHTAFIAGIPGIGPKRAAALAACAPRLCDVLTLLPLMRNWSRVDLPDGWRPSDVDRALDFLQFNDGELFEIIGGRDGDESKETNSDSHPA